MIVVLLLLLIFFVGYLMMLLNHYHEQQRQRQEQCLENAGSDIMERAVCNNNLIIGMSKSQVRRVWGEPNYINITTNADGALEQWVYSSFQKYSYVYFQNGTLTIIQN